MAEFVTNVAQQGNNILVRGYHDDGSRLQRKVKYAPYLFVPSDREEAHKTIDGRNVRQLEFESISHAREHLKTFDGVEGYETYGYERWPHVFLYDEYKDQEPDISQVRVCAYDIEVDSSAGFPRPEEASKEVLTVAFRHKNLRIVFGTRECNDPGEGVYYAQCKDEQDLLAQVIDHWVKSDFDVITGWNINLFDTPYLVNRISQVLGEGAVKRLSPWNRVLARTVTIGFKQHTVYDIVGISSLDYLDVYKKFQLAPRDSYKLDEIASVELKRKKVDFRSDGYTTLSDLYERNYDLFVQYNIVDADLVFELDEHLGYFNQLMTLTYFAGVNYVDGLGSLMMWDTKIHNYLMDRHIVVPTRKHVNKTTSNVGGYVKDPQVGKHNWVVSYDLDSLYPHIMMQYNISPDTKVPYESLPTEVQDLVDNISVDAVLNSRIENMTEILQKYNIAMAANGNVYRRDRTGFLSALMNDLYAQRKDYKRKMIEAKQRYELIEREMARRGLLDE